MPPRNAVIHFLDVGQGDAILIQDGFRQMLVDGGPDDAVLAGLGDVMPMFDRTIETVVLTHPHADHFAGLTAVLARYRVERVVVSGARGVSRAYDEFLAAVAAEGAILDEAVEGISLSVSARVSAEVLWPPADPAARAAVLADADENASSIVLRVESGGSAALLMGDATAEVEAALLVRDDVSEKLRAALLKVAHHGSRHSSTAAFLAAVRPEHAVISVGGSNKYGHPGWAVLRRLETLGAQIWRTDEDGVVRAEFGLDSFRFYAAGK
jgi:competence protein ComEC